MKYGWFIGINLPFQVVNTDGSSSFLSSSVSVHQQVVSQNSGNPNHPLLAVFSNKATFFRGSLWLETPPALVRTNSSRADGGHSLNQGIIELGQPPAVHGPRLFEDPRVQAMLDGCHAACEVDRRHQLT